MKRTWNPYSGVMEWWRCLSPKEKLYTVYFCASLLLLLGTTEGCPLWAVFASLLNFGNSVRLLKRVSIDKLED